MSVPTTTAAPASPPPLPGAPTVGRETRLAPPLPAPTPDPRRLGAAGLLLLVALSLLWFTAARRRRRQHPAHELRQTFLLELDRIQTMGRCPCPYRRPAAAECPTAAGQRPCAERVHGLLTEFAATATGLPCSRLTTEELRASGTCLPDALRDAFAHLVETLAAADLSRFSPRSPPAAGICLVEAAKAALRNWPGVAAATPAPAPNGEPS